MGGKKKKKKGKSKKGKAKSRPGTSSSRPESRTSIDASSDSDTSVSSTGDSTNEDSVRSSRPITGAGNSDAWLMCPELKIPSVVDLPPILVHHNNIVTHL